MGTTISKKYKILKNKDSADENSKLSDPTAKEIKQAEETLSKEIFALINRYRKGIQASQCGSNPLLQRAAETRAQEVQLVQDHIRPNGKEGSQLPYEYGYAPENLIEGEAIGRLSSPSFAFLKKAGAQTVFKMLIESTQDFLAGSTANEQAVGVCLKKNLNEFLLAFVYICGENQLQNSLSNFSADKTSYTTILVN